MLEHLAKLCPLFGTIGKTHALMQRDEGNGIIIF